MISCYSSTIYGGSRGHIGIKMALLFGALLATCMLLLGCGARVVSGPPTVLVAAAADMMKVSRPLARAFEQATGAGVTFGFGASGQLEQQIRQGASFDVYAPAARSYCTSIERAGLTDGKVKSFAFGRLVAWSKTVRLNSLQELTGSRVKKIAIGNPTTAPYGEAAREALKNSGLWPEIESKVVMGETVAHALQMAETGNAEVAFVPMALVQDAGAYSFSIEPRLYHPIEQAAVVLKDSKNKQAARAFLEFLGGPEAQRILAEYGFGHVAASAP
jgi:molybdate transport system substrate-binding protein